MSNKDNKYTFKKLLEEYKIVIPIIQREYAQGRNTPRARKVRKEFIATLKKHLKENSLHLDFIFGIVKDDGKEVFTLENEKQKIRLIVERKEQGEKRILIPIDGQQRLTLLFLLHYYLGVRAGEDVKYLKRFTYEVRDSSRDFIEKLVEETGWKDKIEDVKCEGEDKQGCLSKWIQNQLWFLPGWEKDPTLQSMLTVLDEIHRQFKEEKDFKKFYQNLNNITFEFMEMKDYNLDEELYIKLNSTGRQLTELEIFKAEFQKLLQELGDDFKDEYKDFQHKIDNEWMDTFWKNFKYKQDKEDEYYAVDATMLNFFYYMIEMLLFEMLEPSESRRKKKAEEKSKDELSERFYNGDRWWDHLSLWEIFEELKNGNEDKKEIFKKWLYTLFYALNNLDDIHRQCDCVFHSGSLDEITPNDWEKVAIWTDNPNLLERVIFNYRYRFAPHNDNSSDFKFSSIETDNEKLKKKIEKADEKQIFGQLNLAEKILLYTLIKAMSHQQRADYKTLRDILRLARNIVWSVNKISDIEQRLNLQARNVHYILKLFNISQLFVRGHLLYSHDEIEKMKDIKFSDYLNLPTYRYKHEYAKQEFIKEKPHIKCHIYALENHPYLKGDLRIFLHEGNGENIINNLGEYTKIFYEIFKQDDTKIIPALISVSLEKDEDGELSMFNCSNDLEKKFFGYKNYWGYLLHSLSEDRLNELQPIWLEFLKRVKERCGGDCVGESVKNALSSIKNEFTYRSKDVKDWRYYYAKYGEFYENYNYEDFGVQIKYNIFFIPRENGKLNWFFAEKLKKKTVKGHHLNPFLYAICKKLSKEKGLNCTTKSENDGIILHSGWDRWGENFDSYIEIKKSDISIKTKIKTNWCENKKAYIAEGWEIEGQIPEEVKNRLKEKGLDIEENVLDLKDNKDLIETLEEFISQLSRA